MYLIISTNYQKIGMPFIVYFKVHILALFKENYFSVIGLAWNIFYLNYFDYG